MNQFISLVLITSFLTLFSSCKPVEEEAPEPPKQSIYYSWDTLEFDKCVAGWMIIRFLDPQAELKFMPKDTWIEGGIAFDIPGEPWSRQHLKSTSDCIMESLQSSDPALIILVSYAHNVELNFWQLDSFPEAKKCFLEVARITEKTSDINQSFPEVCKYLDRIYANIKQPEVSEEKSKKVK